MALFYLETSALLKRYRREFGSEIMSEIVSDTHGHSLFLISQLTLLEVHAVIMRLLRGRAIRVSEHRRIVAELAADITLPQTVIVDTTPNILNDALDMVQKHALKAPDAIQLAAAMVAKATSGNEQFVFVTSDQELLQACTAEQLAVLDPSAPSAPAQLRSLRG